MILCTNNALALTASYSTTVSSGCVPLVVDFTDATSGGPISWDYDFDDGGSSTTQNPRYTFTKPGTYKVKLTVFDGSSYSSYTTTIVVKKLPVAGFSTTAFAYCPGDQIVFTNATQAGDTTIKSISWDMGDGNVYNTLNNITKSYNNAGSYTIKMTVRDNNNCVNTISKNQYLTIYQKPNPVFNYVAKYSCIAPQRVNFSNNSGNSVSYLWDFGDGNTSTIAVPTIFYMNAGNYTVKLTATSDKGCKASTSTTIPVSFGKIKANFDAANYSGCIPFDPKFKNTSTPTGAKFDYYWEFADGSKSTSENPIKVYSKTGTYLVKFRITGNGAGCTDSIYKTVLVSDKPKAILSLKDSLNCTGYLSNVYKAKSSSTIDNYTWFIDGKNIDTKVDTLKYAFFRPGEYKIQVLMKDIAGCQQVFQFPKVVVQNLLVGFFLEEPGGCVPYMPKIRDTSKAKIPVTLYYTWKDGNGNTYNSPTPKITYNKIGKYEINLKVRDQYGCEDSAWDIVGVGNKMPHSFKIDKNAICNRESITMTNTTPDSIMKKVDSWIWIFTTSTGSNPYKFVTSTRDYPKTYTPMLIAIHNQCRDTVLKEDSIKIKPVMADFIYSFDTCFSNTGTLRHKSVLATDFTWILPNGSTSKDSVIYHKFKTGVKEKFRVIASNKLTGCIDTVDQDISPPVSTSNLKVTKKTDCTPVVYLLENYMTRASRNHWDLGNGDTTARPDSFRYAFKNPGTYTIKHTGWDIRSCPYTSKQTVVIEGPSTGGKIWPDKGCLPLTIQLIDSVSSGKIKRKYWKFEDDPQWRKATNKKDTLSYTITSMPMSGDSFYHIELFVEDSSGCQSTRVFKVRPSGPRAAVTLTSTNRCDATEFSLNANIDSVSAYHPLTLTWDMGDGKIITEPSFKYIYRKGGKYKINLQLKDGLGCSFSESYNVTTTDPEILASFTSDSSTSVCAPLLTTFKSTSLHDPGQPIVSYYWDFGDGTNSNVMSPSKLYTQPGKYTVTLTVKNSFGCGNTTSIKNYIHVGGPTAAYSFGPKIICQNSSIEFKSLITPNTIIEWDLGDGNVIKSKNVNYRYSKPGKYFPKILLKDSIGCITNIIPKDSIIIHPNPIADVIPSSHCLDDLIEFKNNSGSGSLTNPLYTTFWLIDGDTFYTKDVSLKFATTGLKPLQLLITNDFACKDTVIQNFAISKPLAKFDVVKTKLCLGDSLIIDNQGQSNNGIKKINYYFNDILQSKKTLYPLKGDIKVVQVITDTFHCKDTFKIDKTIHTADTVPPLKIDIRKISHTSNTEVEWLYHTSNDVDFKQYTLFQNINNTWVKLKDVTDANQDQLQFIINPIQTSNCYSMTQTNYCGAESEMATTHCNIELKVVAGINKNYLSWNAYSGWMADKYVIQREQDKGVFINIGETQSLQFIDSTIICNQQHAYRIKAIGSIEFSHSDTAKAKAKWDNIVPAPMIDLVTVYNDTGIIIQWHKDETYKRSQIEYITLKKQSVNAYSLMDYHADSMSKYDRAVNVDLFRYSYFVRAKDNCGDSSSYSIVSNSILLQSFKIQKESAPGLTWNRYKTWNNGVMYYEVQRQMENGEFNTIYITNDTFYIDEGTQKSCMKQYVYRIIARQNNSQVYSTSNVIKIQPMSLVYIPNAFTPNNNKLNETFEPVTQYVYNPQLEIFNQWGEKLYEIADCNVSWDGTYKGNDCPQGVYFYKYSARGVDGKFYVKKGSINLLR